jgi:hypothetical protein
MWPGGAKSFGGPERMMKVGFGYNGQWNITKILFSSTAQ